MPRIARRKLKAPKASAHQPGYDGMRELQGRTVEDPYDPENQIVVPANVKHDPLHRMFARGEIDRAQLKAGETLQDAFEMTATSGVRVMNTMQDRVDGGSIIPGISGKTMDAARRLRQAQALLGWQGYRIVVSVVCLGLNGSLIAQQSRAVIDRKVVQYQVRSGLEQLAILWGFVSDPKHVRTQASMVGMMRERADWGHEETDIVIRYKPAD